MAMETALSTLAQVFVSPLVGTISDHYGPAIFEKIGIKWDVNEEMEKLSDILLTIQEVLDDAEDKQTTSKPIRNWLRKLKDITYDVEDILDECKTEEALHEAESTGIINGAAMVDRIKQLIDKFDKITEQRSRFNLINLSSTTRVVVNYRVDPRRETSSIPTELKVYGRDEEKERIVNLMVNNINAGNLSIYAIVGIGGLGKTTLAKMVYNDNMVKSRFEIKRWVCVSENFEVKSLIGDIIQSGSNNNSQTLDQLQHRLQKILSGKRFLLVLDDVWNEDPEEWSKLRSSLTCGAKGSSIIVTTRSNRVASLMAGSSHVCHPKMLTEEDCFSLFKHHAFEEGVGDHYPKLESIGKEIVKKCGGVPLAAKALGGLLRFHREEKEWLFVKESKLWDLQEDSIMPALRLSYKHLPQHLRQCFAHCSIFPKDYIMEKEVLIQLWMANGFLPPKGNMELEDIGNGAFNDLLCRGFFQEVTFDIDRVIRCKMHDLVHDLACSITRDECFSVVTDADKELVVERRNTTRHLAIYSDILFSPNFNLSIIQSFLRTCLQLDVYMYNTNVPPPLNLSNLIYLRVLDLRGSRGLKTLESIGKMKLLRYLDLSRTSIALLSDEVFGNLINLQTLKLCHCKNLEMLPGNMSKLTNLRHLNITESTGKLLGMPVGMGLLKSLHKLSHFIVSEKCGVGELQELDHLGGRLEITCLWKVKDVRDAENAKLSRKENIRFLKLDWSKSITATAPVPSESQTNSMNDDKLIADALQPRHNLEGLEFSNYGGCDFPSWMNSTCLSSLETLELRNCSKCKHLPTLGLLPHLKKLWLVGMPIVECIGNEFYCDEEEGNNMMMKTRGIVLFPALEELKLYNMPSLEEWKVWSSSSRMKEGETQVSVFPVLKTLRIEGCDGLKSLPDDFQNLISLEELKVGCDGLKSLNKCLQHLTNLHKLEINYGPELELLPDDFQNLTSLKSLNIYGCYGLKSLNNPHKLELLPDDFQNLISLEELRILGCVGLKSLNKCLQHLTNLHKLEIDYCPKLELLPDDFQNLTSLKTLRIERCYGLKSLNNCLQHLTNLHELTISSCPKLELLPDDFQNLVSLQSLILSRLPKLAAVPVIESTNQILYLFNCENLKSLPEGIQHLTALQSLWIDDCHPELHKRCEKNTGEDWHKIAHIPALFIIPPPTLL